VSFTCIHDVPLDRKGRHDCAACRDLGTRVRGKAPKGHAHILFVAEDVEVEEGHVPLAFGVVPRSRRKFGIGFVLMLAICSTLALPALLVGSVAGFLVGALTGPTLWALGSSLR
jgi:hypothetical protein